MSRFADDFQRILIAARAGADWAWTEIYRELAPTVVGYLRQRGAVDPDDVCGEVFCQIVRDIGRFSGDADGFRSWVFVTAHRRMLDDFRKRGRRADTVGDPDDLKHLPDAADVEGEGMEMVQARELRRHLDTLTDAQREVVLLRVLGGMTVEEVALATGRRAGAVKALQRRGLAALRRSLDLEGYPPSGQER